MSSGKASTICWAVHEAVGVRSTLKCMTRRRWGEHDEDEEDAQVSSRNGEIDRDQIPDVVVRNVCQVCDGGVRRFGISRETVRSATSRPNLRNSPWILGAPHRGFA